MKAEEKTVINSAKKFAKENNVHFDLNAQIMMLRALREYSESTPPQANTVTDAEIEIESKKCKHPMTSIAEGIYVPEGFVKGAKWMRERTQQPEPREEETKK